jgi:hypothetical protein
MKKLRIALFAAVFAALLMATGAFAEFANGSFEAGNFNGWINPSTAPNPSPLTKFINPGLDNHGDVNYTAFTAADIIRNTKGTSFPADLSAVIGPFALMSQTDPNTGNALHYPFDGEYVARINSEDAYRNPNTKTPNFGGNANSIRQTATAIVDPADNLVHVRFVYAAVMADPGSSHKPYERPWFFVGVTNKGPLGNGADLVYEQFSYVGQTGTAVTWLTGASNTFDWKYTDWISVDIISTAEHPMLAGDEIEIEVIAAGCSPTGHPGYVYVDQFGFTLSDPPPSGLAVSANDAPDPVVAGSILTYTFNYQTIDAATAPVITIPIPAQTTFNSVSDTTHCSYSSVPNAVTCTMPDLAAGASGGPFTVNVTVDGGAAGSTVTLENYTIQSASSAVNTGASVTTLVVAPSAVLSVTASGGTTIMPGAQYIYNFTFTTDITATDAQLAFALPTHATYVSNTGGYICTSNAGTVTCDLGTFSTGGSFTVTVLVDKLKLIGATLTLPTTDYSISAANAALTNGLAIVTADVLTPFGDVPADANRDYIQSIWAFGITRGCSMSGVLMNYCPSKDITRGETAAYIERAVHTGAFVPPVVPLTYSDTGSNLFRYYIEALKADGITNGCNTLDPTLYCPLESIKRSQTAIFLLRGKYWPAVHVPPAATGTVFTDVPANSFAAGWIEELHSLGIISGCTATEFCPNGSLTRTQMATLVQKTFNLTMPSP